jgi:hypothetical protein
MSIWMIYDEFVAMEAMLLALVNVSGEISIETPYFPKTSSLVIACSLESQSVAGPCTPYDGLAALACSQSRQLNRRTRWSGRP